MEQNEIMKALGQALAPYMNEHQKHDLPTSFSISTNQVHGPGGIFGVPGVDRDVFSTRVQARGLLSQLKAYGTNVMNPVVGYLTGFTAPSGDEQDGPCDDPPHAGQLKSCFTGSQFGRVARTTETIDVSAAGQFINRGEMNDLRLVNEPLLQIANMMLPPSIPSSGRSVFASELAAKMVALGVTLEDVYSHMLWTGNPLNNSANSGYMEFYGIESLVTETHTDVFTSANCPSLASLIMDAGGVRIDQEAAQIFNYLTTMWRITNENAENMNMKPVQWKFVMNNALFRELTDYWPCVYASYRCGATNNQLNNNTDAMAMREMSDRMYRGKFLTIDSEDIPVVTDSALPVEWNKDNANVPSGSMMSDIYLLPFVVRGGREVLYLEYFNFEGPGAASDIASEGRISSLLWTDGGRWLWTPRQTLYCFDWTVLSKLRCRLDTPHLAARLQNVMVTPLRYARQPHFSDPYYVNGGNVSTGSTGLPYVYTGRD
jgi:hypothetical protein